MDLSDEEEQVISDLVELQNMARDAGLTPRERDIAFRRRLEEFFNTGTHITSIRRAEFRQALRDAVGNPIRSSVLYTYMREVSDVYADYHTTNDELRAMYSPSGTPADREEWADRAIDYIIANLDEPGVAYAYNLFDRVCPNTLPITLDRLLGMHTIHIPTALRELRDGDFTGAGGNMAALACLRRILGNAQHNTFGYKFLLNPQVFASIHQITMASMVVSPSDSDRVFHHMLRALAEANPYPIITLGSPRSTSAQVPCSLYRVYSGIQGIPPTYHGTLSEAYASKQAFLRRYYNRSISNTGRFAPPIQPVRVRPDNIGPEAWGALANNMSIGVAFAEREDDTSMRWSDGIIPGSMTIGGVPLEEWQRQLEAERESTDIEIVQSLPEHAKIKIARILVEAGIFGVDEITLRRPGVNGESRWLNQKVQLPILPKQEATEEPKVRRRIDME